MLLPGADSIHEVLIRKEQRLTIWDHAVFCFIYPSYNEIEFACKVSERGFALAEVHFLKRRLFG